MGQPSEPVRLLPHARLLVTTILRYLSKTCVSSATTERRVRTASCPSLSMLGQHLANRSRSPHATSRRGKSKIESRRADSNRSPAHYECAVSGCLVHDQETFWATDRETM